MREHWREFSLLLMASKYDISVLCTYQWFLRCTYYRYNYSIKEMYGPNLCDYCKCFYTKITWLGAMIAPHYDSDKLIIKKTFFFAFSFYHTIIFKSVVFMPIKPSQIDAHIRTSNDKIAARRLLALKNRLSDGTPARIPVT